MKRFIFSTAAVLSIALAAHVAEAVMPFNFKYYGNFREIMKKKVLEEAVELDEASSERAGPGISGNG